jgi:ABC-2 type transport system permease protein
MSPWKLEALRLWRTRRLVALAGAFAILGLGIPILTYELPSLIKNGTGGIQVTVPRQTPLDSLVSFGSNAAQLGTLVLVLVAAASLALDARPALAAFYCSRAVRPYALLPPRYAMVATAGVASFALGIGCAWYETDLLLGSLDPVALVAGFGLESLWVCFCVAVVALWASIARSVLAVVGTSLASLLALAFLSDIHPLHTWLPSALGASVADLVGPHHPGVPWAAVAISAAATVALVGTAVTRLSRRPGPGG